jgi:CubicO group peptidase (beta-lactamase class C family)
MRITTTCRLAAGWICAWAAGAVFAAAPVAPATPATLRTAIADAMKEHNVPGATYAVFDRDGTVLSGTLGLANVGTGAKTTATTLFRVGSITKSVTAVAIMQLIEQGRFTLQTPVSQLLPTAPLDNRYDASDPVRVVHLLTHTAGLDDTHPQAFFANDERRGQHLASSIAHPESLKVRWRPGTYQSYSNTGYILLGAILEAHYRQPWDEIVKRQVLQPLAMHRTVALASVAMRGDHARGHTGGAMRPTPMPFDLTQAHGALWSTADDMSRLGRFFLTGGTSAPGVLKRESILAMQRTQGSTGAAAGLVHGNGLGLRSRVVDGERWQGHSGGVMGAVASMHYHAGQGMGYVIMLNSENMLRKAEVPLARFIASQSGWQAPRPVPTQVASDVNGWYRTVNPRVSLLALPTLLLSGGYAEARGNELIITPTLPGMGMQATLRHYGKGLLADIDDGGTTVNGVIIRDASGTVSAFELDGVTMLRSSMPAVALPLASVLVSVALLITVPFGRRRALRNPWIRRLPALALLVAIGGVVSAANLKLHLLAEINWQTVGVCLAGALFPLLALAGVVLSMRTWRLETAALAKWRCLLGSLGGVVLGLWLAAFQLAGLALWAW